MPKNPKLTGILAAVSANIIFGAAFPFTKFLFDANISYYAMLSWRFLFACAAMGLLAVFGVFRLRFRGKKIIKLLPIALCEPCLYFIFESYGIDRTTAAESSAIIATIPIGVMLASFFFLREKIRPLQILAVIVSVAGVIVMLVGGSFDASFSIAGYLFLFAAVAAAVFYNIGVRRVIDEFSSVEITFATTVAGMLFFNGIALVRYGLFERDMSPMLLPFATQDRAMILASILFLAFASSIAAFILINISIARIGPTRASTFAGFTALVSVVGGMLFIGERLSLIKLAGIALVVLGVYGANRRTKPKEPEIQAL